MQASIPINTNLNSGGAFIANLDNAAFVTGTRDRIGNSRTMMIIALILFVIAAGLGGYVGLQLWNHQQLETVGKVATGRITDGYSRTGDSNSYHLTVEYIVAGQTYSFEQEVSRIFYNDADVYIGARLNVRYLPNTPSIAEIETQGINLTDRGSYLIGLIVVAVFLLIFALWVVLADARNRRYSNNGQFITGQIIKARGWYYRGSYNLSITYNALSPTGATLKKKETVRRRDLRGWVPPIGTPVIVRYIHDRAFRLM